MGYLQLGSKASLGDKVAGAGAEVYLESVYTCEHDLQRREDRFDDERHMINTLGDNERGGD